ncbi:gfo/Idh/MocA family oxidoreductase [Granulicella sp. 5B5]|uniref:Gfo/Idh/MocA family protein n=1 Tax=Granulicella sp. 5B5 TaxID=1617967 RepID=UPI0015F3B670|nr:Gfo/Idh/MocA family oxidoreductase [Granulicella sp. 5B5]QMV19404.1 gfo/Idh/MocA family oxidoreductase [Granulicella sp. 5B5]
MLDRRGFLRGVGAAGLATTMAMDAGAVEPAGLHVTHEVVEAQAEEKPKYHIKFAVCGMSHDHIYGMIGAIQRGGGEMVAAWAGEPDKLAAFRKRFPDVKIAASQDEIIHDNSIQLVLSSQIPVERAPLGIKVMRSGKDFLSDKPGMLTLEQLAEVRRTIAETHRIYAIMYSELLEVKAAVKAGELVKAGAIGRVIQTINIAPHQIYQGHGDAGGGAGRPDWYWVPEIGGGILNDIGSHQVDQFLYYTGSTEAEVVESQVANVAHPDHPKFFDFGDMVLRGNRGLGYVRLDWFTPDGLGTWGDGRLFILGTEGYIEVRKYINVAVSKQGNNLFIVDQKQSRYIDCNNVNLPFGALFVADIVNRTHNAQDQTQALLAAELVIKAQMNAKHVHLEA